MFNADIRAIQEVAPQEHRDDRAILAPAAGLLQDALDEVLPLTSKAVSRESN
jgi:hypothetical protein